MRTREPPVGKPEEERLTVIVTHNSNVQRRGYSALEVAEMLGITRRTVYNLIASGELRSFHIGRAVRIRAEDVDRLVVTGTD